MEIKTRQRKPIFYFLIAIYFLFLIEILSRVYFVQKYETSFITPIDYIYKYYPELKHIKRGINRSPKDAYKVLLLGGSVMNNDFGNIQIAMGKMLSEATGKYVEIFNLAERAHTSLDSYYKYSQLININFDLVVLYHGINELRANNCPPDIFQTDYSHYDWYNELNLLTGCSSLEYSAIPAVSRLFYNRFNNFINGREFIEMNQPRQEWLQYGSDIKTAESFSDNLESIIDLAEQKDEQILMMSFASFVPDNYSLESFAEKSLEYSSNQYPIEIWGQFENIIKGLGVHNQVLSNISKNHNQVLFVDQNQLIPKDGIHFNDICHLTNDGCFKFTENIYQEITRVTTAELED